VASTYTTVQGLEQVEARTEVGYSSEEAALIEEHLRALGYME